jgi:hypothetical protein
MDDSDETITPVDTAYAKGMMDAVVAALSAQVTAANAASGRVLHLHEQYLIARAVLIALRRKVEAGMDPDMVRDSRAVTSVTAESVADTVSITFRKHVEANQAEAAGAFHRSTG